MTFGPHGPRLQQWSPVTDTSTERRERGEEDEKVGKEMKRIARFTITTLGGSITQQKQAEKELIVFRAHLLSHASLDIVLFSSIAIV